MKQAYSNLKLNYFMYKRESYPPGTKLIYNGRCYYNGEEAILNNVVVTWLYNKGADHHLLYNNTVYTCPCWEFEKKIVKIIRDKPEKQENNNQKTEIYWTNDMVAKTLWYILIMLAATIFNDRVGIWILATVVWYASTFKKQ